MTTTHQPDHHDDDLCQCGHRRADHAFFPPHPCMRYTPYKTQATAGYVVCLCQTFTEDTQP